MTHPRRTIPALLLALLTSCGGGGGGGGGPGAATFVPELVAAALDGNAVLLLFSDAVEASGAVLDAEDLAVGGGTFGSTAVPAPTRIDDRSLRIELAQDALLVAGRSTVALTAAQDAIRARGGGPRAAATATPLVLTQADGEAAVADLLTLNAIDRELAGTGAAVGLLQVPPAGFTIDVGWSDPSSPVDAAATILLADRAVGTSGGLVAPGANLARVLSAPLVAGARARFAVPAGVAFPPGDLTLTALNADASGRPAAPATFRLRIVPNSAAIRPTETEQVWALTFDRDIERFEFQTGGGLPGLRIDPTPNGVPDAFDALAAVGLWYANPLPGVQGGLDSNEFVLAELQGRIGVELEALFEGVAVRFTFDDLGSFPAGAVAVPYASFGFSRLCIGGAASSSPTGTLGAALFDPNNQTQDDNAAVLQAGDRLGVFLHTLVAFGLRSGTASLFRQTFDPLTPGFGGTPVGAVADDRLRLTDALNDARTAAIAQAIRRMARAIAVVVAHECGHSMGLVANGAMPGGLFGGDPGNFPGSTSLHIATPALFPTDAQNVMSPAIDFDRAMSPATGFNSLNLAYLREQALYDLK
jgi:hypothetical protein